MRNEAPVIVLAEWSRRTNAATRRLAGAAVEPIECREARGYLDGLMNDAEAAARVRADIARVRAFYAPDDGWDDEAWADAAREYHKDRPPLPWQGVSQPSVVAESGLQAVEYLVQLKDPARLRRWLARRSAAERKAILQHLEQHKKRGGDNGN